MSVKANKTVIGGFVVGALALAVVAVIVFGGGKFLTDSQRCVFNFEGSVDGLNIGAPIALKGVKIGTVTDIQMLFCQEKMDFRTMVLGELHGNIQPENPELMQRLMEEQEMTEQELRAFFVRELVDKHGLRAQLKVQSMVTGLLEVSLDFHPDSKAKRFGAEEGIEEVPTIPMMMEELSNTFSEIPFAQILSDMQKTMEGINNIVNSPELRGSIAKLDDTMTDLKALTAKVNENFEPMRADIEKLVGAAHSMVEDTHEKIIPITEGVDETIKETRDLVRNVNDQIEPMATRIGDTMDDTRQLVNKIDDQLIENLKETVISAKSAMKQADSSLALLKKEYISPQSPMYHELIKTLERLSDAMASVHEMTAYLERHPEALLKGKQGD